MTVRKQPYFLVEDNDDDADLAMMAFNSAKAFLPSSARTTASKPSTISSHADSTPVAIPSTSRPWFCSTSNFPGSAASKS